MNLCSLNSNISQVYLKKLEKQIKLNFNIEMLALDTVIALEVVSWLVIVYVLVTR